LAVVLAGFCPAAAKIRSSTRAIWLTATEMLVALPIARLTLLQLSLPLLPAEPIAVSAYGSRPSDYA
jgi:hypothetical protein